MHSGTAALGNCSLYISTMIQNLIIFACHYLWCLACILDVCSLFLFSISIIFYTMCCISMIISLDIGNYLPHYSYSKLFLNWHCICPVCLCMGKTTDGMYKDGYYLFGSTTHSHYCITSSEFSITTHTNEYTEIYTFIIISFYSVFASFKLECLSLLPFSSSSTRSRREKHRSDY